MVSFLFFGCNNQHELEKSTHIAPPKKEITPEANEFTILAEQESTIKLDNGSSIEIPANAFVDENGNAVKGKVVIDYQEFHNAPSVIASGIPMTFKHNGQVQHFQTAGMFEIQGYLPAAKTAQVLGKSKKQKKGKAIYIKEGQQINVNMASFTGEDDYNFYLFDEKNGEWQTLGNSKKEMNEDKQAKLDSLDPLPEEPIKPKKHDPKKPVFELDVDTKKFPELAHFEGIMWEYSGEKPEEDPTNPKNAWIGKIHWDNISVAKKETGLYRMTLKKGDKSFSTDVTPALSGLNYRKALKKFEQSIANFEQAKKQRKKEEERLSAEGNFIRSASISRFGVYNHDRFYNMQDAITLNATFQLDNQAAFPTDATVFLVTGENRAIVKYPKSTWENFRFVASDQNKLVTILDNGQVGVFTTEDFATIAASKPKQQLFRLKVVNNINSFEALQNLMTKL